MFGSFLAMATHSVSTLRLLGFAIFPLAAMLVTVPCVREAGFACYVYPVKVYADKNCHSIPKNQFIPFSGKISG